MSKSSFRVTRGVAMLLLPMAATAFGEGLTGKWSGTLEVLGPDGSVARSSDAFMDLKVSESQQNEISNGVLEGKKLTCKVAQNQGPTLNSPSRSMAIASRAMWRANRMAIGWLPGWI